MLQARFTGVSMASGDQLGARALANGVVTVYKNGVMLGSVNVTAGPRPWPAALAAGGGQIGVYYNYIGLLTSPRFDNFGGGTMPGSVMAADEGASDQTEIFYGDAPAGLGEVDNSKQMQEGYEAEYLFLPAISSQ